MSGGYSFVERHGLLAAVAPVVADHGLQDNQLSGVAT